MGQRRRAVLAASWIGTPRVVLLDEPLEGMDREMQERIIAWVQKLDASEATVLVATHDLDPFTLVARRAIGFDGPEPRVHALPSVADARREELDRIARQRLRSGSL
jgi:ABC-type Mn2+/Zn2+ transport system ATPase subunit